MNTFISKKLSALILFLALVGGTLFVSCEIDEPDRVFPLNAEIFHSEDGLQVAFTALTHSAVSWSWDFGDGNSSSEQSPVHVYDKGGYYLVTLIAKDASGASVTRDVTLALDLSPFDLLVGDPTQEGYKGKTWKLSSKHGENDKIVNSDIGLTLFDKGLPSLPGGAFGLYLGMEEAYNDEFTFHHDGSYIHNTTDGLSFGGIVFGLVMDQLGLTKVTKVGGKAALGADAFAMTTYSPDENATFVFTENEDFTIPTIPDFATGVVPPGVPVVTYPGVMTLDFPNSDEFVGIRDFHQKVIVQQIDNNSMRLVMFMTLAPEAIVSMNPLIALSTTALILSFEAVK